MNEILIRCAWCQKDMGEKPPYEDTSVTHTICDECRKKYFPEKEGSMERWKSVPWEGAYGSSQSFEQMIRLDKEGYDVKIVEGPKAKRTLYIRPKKQGGARTTVFAWLVFQNEIDEVAQDALEHNPMSAHCEAVLAKPPKCFDFRGVRAFVMCRAWDILEKEKRTKLPVSEAWREARKVCERE